MDNLTEGTSDPQEAADVTAASGQSDEVETQTEPETVVVDGETDEGTETELPWNSDERFKGKTPAEMFAIVQEADKYKGQLSQKAKVADLLSQKFGLTPERMEQIANEQAQVAHQQKLQSDPLAQVYDELQQVKQQMVIKDEDAKLDSFLKEKPEFAAFRNEIRTLGYSVDRDKTWDQVAEKYFAKAINQGQESAYKKIETKTKTQTAGVSRGDTKRTITLDDMRGMTSKEMEAFLPHA